MAPRPPVSIVLPFHGTRAEAEAALDAIGRIRVADGDEVVVVDNTGARAVPARDGFRVIAADAERSAYHARNVGAGSVTTDWLAFVDADCIPDPGLLDAYFSAAIGDGVGAVVGEVVGRAGQQALVARYQRSRGHIAQAAHVEHPYRPFGVTANLLVRRAAWESIGGFSEGVRSGGDIDFSWRLQEAGWTLDYRPSAVVEHDHREDVRALSRVAARYGAGRAWLHRRYPQGMNRPPLVRPLARSVAGTVAWGVTARFERAAFKALDGVFVSSEAGAALLSNTPPVAVSDVPRAAVAVVCGAFPALDAPDDVSTVRGFGGGVTVEAARRPVRQDRLAARELVVRYAEDDGVLRRLGAAGWHVRRRPREALALVRSRELLDVAVVARRLAGAGVVEVRAVGDGDVLRRAEAIRSLVDRSDAGG